ncbi:MAG: PAS domain S-box protein [Nitrospira sp.]|nr:PAS domain S-box protein [Nitrospira sp.]
MLIRKCFAQSLTYKLMALFFAVFFCAVCGLTYFAYTSSRNAMFQEFKIRGRTLAKSIAPQARTHYQEQDVEGLTSLLQSLGEGEDVVAILAYRSSKVLWIEFSGIQLTPEDLTLPELGDVWERDLVLTKGYRVSAFGSVVTDSSTPAGKDGVVTAQPLGWVRIFLDRGALERRLGTLINETLAMSILTLLLGGGLFILLLRQSLHVIGPLTDATKKVAEGDLHATVPVSSNDELGELAKCFNSMTEQLLQTTVSKNYVDNIIRSMIDSLIVVKPDGTIGTVNRATLQLLGYDEHELLGQHISMLFPQKKDAFSGHPYGDFSWNNTSDLGEVTYRTKNGRAIPILFSEAILRDEDGRILGVACVGKDMTKLREAEEQLRIQGAALESAANAVVITDFEGRITWANPSFTRLTGYSLEEAIGRPMGILKSGTHDDSFYRTLWQTILSGSVWQGELINRKKDGTLFTEEQTITPIRGQSGIIDYFISIKQDITARKQIEKALLASEQYNRTLFELSPIGLALFDMDGTVVDCNEAYAAIVGLTRSDVLGMTYWELTPNEYDERAFKIMEVITKTGSFRNYEKHYIHRDGHWVPVRVFGNLIERDNRLYLCCSVEDITDRRRSEEALTAANRKLTELNETRSEFFANISHELRTPLTVIRGEAEVTIRGKDKPLSEYKAALERIVQLTAQVNQLVGDLLFISRSESGTIAIDKQPTPLLDILLEVHQEAQVLAEKQRITVTLTTRHAPPIMVHGDPQRLRQLFMIIITNAINYTKPEGTITVHWERDGKTARVVVIDNGIGIPKEDLPYVFQRFYRVKQRHHTLARSGSGLGLPIAKWIAEAHNGTISIASIPDRGTTVTVELPLYGPQGPPTGTEDGHDSEYGTDHGADVT